MVGITVPQISRIICYDKQKIKITRKISINGTTKLEIPNTDFNQPFIVIDPLQTKPPLISGSDPSLMAPSVTPQAVAGFGGANQLNVYLNKPLVVTLNKNRSFEGVCIAKNTNNTQFTVETKDTIEIVNMNDVYSISYLKGDNLSPTSTLITIFGNGNRDIEVSYFILKDPNLRVKHQIGFKTIYGANIERYSLHLITHVIWNCIEKIDYPIKLRFIINQKTYKINGFIGGYLEQTKNEIIRFETDVKKVIVYTDMKLDYQAFLLKNISSKCIPTGPIVVEESHYNDGEYLLELCEPNEHVIVYCPPVIGSSLVLKPDLYVKKTSSISPIRIPRLTYSKMVTSLSLEANVSVSFLFDNLTASDYSIVLRNHLSALPQECHQMLYIGAMELSTNNATKLSNQLNSFYLIELPRTENKTLTFKGVRIGTKIVRQQIDLSSFKFMERVFGAVNQENRDEFETTNVNVDNKEDQDVLYECFKHYITNPPQQALWNNNSSPKFGQQKTQTFVHMSSNNEGVVQPQNVGFGSGGGGGLLFGANSSGGVTGAVPSSGGGLFGASSVPSSGGGLFGGSQPTTTTVPSTGGLFGASQPTTTVPSTIGGLFGCATSRALFGAPVSASSTLGGSQPTIGGLFGAGQPTTGGLFGTSKPTTGGGLFGASQPTTGGLFGTSKPTTGGLFGASWANPEIVGSKIELQNLSFEELRLRDVNVTPKP
ncbi:hypothetical protein DFA_11965 [Cavenderia fasciculata]|uniref:Nucleoporin n=1 Tax=Cavenderia fasciculata TaxID=261658 RepID=F4QF42_CACFS|nr:uncharacterized protein DFA_11965 [Cavenderia fasciculata]EGG14196.1 hypothetical protein DFA_11965 [Cavenderia fasciculata]|eukprot:XP_004350904.1 hypothetical protein DFA_11965 [Cavenderia fasciculata]